MDTLAVILVALVAAEHIYILILEMFMWTRPRTLKIFGFTSELASQTKAMAANQGLYNGFLALGLIWGLLQRNPDFSFQLQVFFLLCVISASVFGSFTVKKSIFFIQGLPAIVALVFLILS